MASLSRGGVEILLHPLVVVNMTDHFNRARIIGAETPLAGILLGKSEGKTVEIFTSFDVPVSRKENGAPQLDDLYIVNRRDLLQQNFPYYDVVGWYSVGRGPHEEDVVLHRQVEGLCETPLFVNLLLDGKSDQMKSLPLAIYDGEYVLTEAARQLRFVAREYKVQTDEAERIAVDHVAFLSSLEDTHSAEPCKIYEFVPVFSHLLQGTVNKQMKSFRSATTMLIDHISIVLKYIRAVKSGEQESQHSIIRMIASLTDRLPSLDASEFTTSVKEAAENAVIMGTLSSLTRTAENINISAEKLTMGIDKLKGHGRLY